MRDIGKNIRDLRTQKNMTQDELAENLFVTRQTISNYETGKSRPDIDMLVKIAEVLDADIHHLLYGTQQPVDKKKIRHLIISSTLTLSIGILLGILSPYVEYVRSSFYLVGLVFAQNILLLPLFFLFLGWTMAQLLGMALKKDPLISKWTVYIRWFLLSFVTVYFFIVLSFVIPELIGEYKMITSDALSKSSEDYIRIPAYAEFLFYKVLFPYIFAKHSPEVCIFTLPVGMMLWLFGFPKSRTSGKKI